MEFALCLNKIMESISVRPEPDGYIKELSLSIGSMRSRGKKSYRQEKAGKPVNEYV